MSLLSVGLGYNKTAIIEVDTFTRLLRGQIYDTEEVRTYKPASYMNGFEYMGVAVAGSPITAAVWSCIRRTWFDNHCNRTQFKENIAWVDRDNVSW